MITLSATACIDAPAQIVWQQLAELEEISRWARLDSAGSLCRRAVARRRRRADM